MSSSNSDVKVQTRYSFYEAGDSNSELFIQSQLTPGDDDVDKNTTAPNTVEKADEKGGNATDLSTDPSAPSETSGQIQTGSSVHSLANNDAGNDTIHVEHDRASELNTSLTNTTKVGKTLRRKFPGFSSLDLDSSTSEALSKDNNPTIDHEHLIQETMTNPFEKSLREALHHIRIRSQKRHIAMTTAHYDEHKSTIQPTQPNAQSQGRSAMPELASSSGSGSSNSMPLPLHPSDNKSLLPATKFDSRLLSPQVDVRETIAGSANEMFRPTVDLDDMARNGDLSFTKLELATPVLSQIAGSVDNSMMDTSLGSINPYTVVPSSPAPGNMMNAGPLNECKHVGATSGKDSSTGVDVAALQRLKISDLQAAEARKSNLEQERRWRREAEVEKGVEQVLLAILNQAEKISSGDKQKMVEEDMVDEAFASFFGSYSEDFQVSNAKMRTTRKPSDDQNESGNSDIDAEVLKSQPLLETLSPQYDPSSEKNHNNVSDSISKLSNHELPPLHPQPSDEPKLGTSKDMEQEGAEDDEGAIDLDANDENEAETQLGGNDVDEGANNLVLGRLSKETGGTTGVVLHADDDTDTASDGSDSADPADNEEPIHDDGTENVATATIEQVQDEESRGNDIDNAGSKEPTLASGSPEKPQDVGSFDMVTTSVMKEIYAHLLESEEKESGHSRGSLSDWFQGKDSANSSISNQIKLSWNDDDPDEPGYIVHTLTRSQLQKIEHEFEVTMERIKKTASNAVDGSKKVDEIRPSTSLEVDLEEAESLLDKEVETDDHSGNVDNRNTTEIENTETEPEETPLADPSFPNAKAAGTGEVGDLEIYHLPIVYKAHQTGFEPTKDLVLQPDTVFAGKYYVQGELGSAAFSTAYRCVDLNSGKNGEDGETYYDEVCLKVIKNTKDFFDQSLDEIKILELLRQTEKCHEHNILEMKTFFYHKEHLIIVTELLRQNLFEFGKYITDNDEPRYFTRQRLCYIARQCLIALDFIHKLGLVHSDIKPENILLASYSRARVKVIDFGSSCYLTDRQSSYIQSRSYRAPEVILGLPYDGKIDIWSLGCVIAEMYTGLVTFQNDSLVSMLSRIEAICGAFPKHMIANGRQSGQFFTPNGLLYEKVDVDDESEIRMANSSNFDDDCSSRGDDSLFHVFQPKRTTIAARLGYDEDFMERRRNTWEDEEVAVFIDFLEQLLTIDPSNRLTAAEALRHPWIQSGLNYTEEDLKYPPEEK